MYAIYLIFRQQNAFYDNTYRVVSSIELVFGKSVWGGFIRQNDNAINRPLYGLYERVD